MEVNLKKLNKIKKNKTFSGFNNAMLIIFSLFVLGCSSIDTSLQYYSLNAIEPSINKVSTIENNDDKTFIAISNIILADFLNTGGLVMQVDSHQIQISNQHRWGDKLPHAIAIHLTNSLSKADNDLYIEQKNVNNEHLADKFISLSFEQFTIANQISNEQSETVISGSYTIENNAKTGTNNNKKVFFDIRKPLTQGGYNNAVENFKHSLNELSAQIESTIHSNI